MTEVRFPDMRAWVLDAVRSMSDRAYQESTWGVYDENVKYYDDLDLNVHILYDDTMTLPDPGQAVPQILHPNEAESFIALGKALDPIIDDLGSAPDSAYLADPRWEQVLAAARHAYETMKASE